MIATAGGHPPARKRLSPQQPHQPPGDKDPAQEHGEAVQAVEQLFPRGVALRDAKYDRSEDGEQEGGGEMRKGKGHGFFPIAIW